MKLLQGDLKDRLRWCCYAQIGMGAAVVVYAAVAQVFWVSPANAALAAGYARIAAAQGELQQGLEREKKLPSVETEISRLRQRVDRLNKQLPRRQDLAKFMADMNSISQETSLNNFSWHIGSNAKHSEQFTELPIQLSFEGDFQSSVVQFLQKTEDMQQLARVQTLNLKAEDVHDGRVKAEITMNIYFGDK